VLSPSECNNTEIINFKRRLNKSVAVLMLRLHSLAVFPIERRYSASTLTTVATIQVLKVKTDAIFAGRITRDN
jgi:hypothetical protein